MTGLIVRPLDGASDDRGVHAVFRHTLAMGRPLPFHLPLLDEYAALCLDWYLDEGRAHAAVVDDGSGRLAGYALVCTDTAAYRQWVRRPAVAFARRWVPAMLTGRLASPARQFLALRLRDGWSLRNAPAPREVHAHLNLTTSLRRSNAGLLLRDHIDDVCRRSGATGWYGEVNARVGRRTAALERLVGDVVHRAPNRTATWLAGEPVERVTIVRDVG